MNRVFKGLTSDQVASILKDILIPYMGDKYIDNVHGELTDRVNEANNKLNKIANTLNSMQKTKYINTQYKTLYWKVPNTGPSNKELQIFLQYKFNDTVASSTNVGIIELYIGNEYMNNVSSSVLNSGSNLDFIAHLGAIRIKLLQDSALNKYIAIDIDPAKKVPTSTLTNVIAWSYSENHLYEIQETAPSGATELSTLSINGEIASTKREITDIDKLVRSNDIRWLVPITPEEYARLAAQEKLRPDTEYLVQEELLPEG